MRSRSAAGTRPPATRDLATAKRWFEQFEGARLDGLIVKALHLTCQPDKRVMSQMLAVGKAWLKRSGVAGDMMFSLSVPVDTRYPYADELA